MLASHARMHSIHKLFGNRVRELREEQHMGAAEVAANIGCDVSHYYSIERGAHPPSFALLLAIAKTFKVDEADLFTWPGSGLRHDLREQVRLATPPALAAIKAALGPSARAGSSVATTGNKRAPAAGSSSDATPPAPSAGTRPRQDDSGARGGARPAPRPRTRR
jgi:transcriptional regulator with XRE-family HTH domain